MSVDLGHQSTHDWWLKLTRVGVRWKTVYIALFAALSVGFPAILVSQALHVDESLYLVLGEQIAGGADLYVDTLDHKPPAIFYIAAGAATMFEQPHVPLRLLTYLVVAVTGLLVLRLGTRLYGPKVGMLASLLYVLGSYLPHFDGYFFMTEQYVALCTVVAAGLFLRESTIRTDVGVGLALGVSVLFNQATFLFGGAILCYFSIVLLTTDDRRDDALRLMKRTLAIGGGFLLPVGVTLGAFAAVGLLGPLLRYALVVPLTQYHPPFNLSGHVRMTLSYFPVWVLALAGLVLVGVRVIQTRTADRSAFVACWAVFLSYPGMAHFAGDHKLLYVFPPVAILAAVTLRWFWRNAELRLSLPVRSYRDGAGREQLATLALVSLAVATVGAGAFNVVYGSMVLDETIEDQRETASGIDEVAEGQLYTFPFAFDIVYLGEGLTSPKMYAGGIYSPALADRVTTTLERKKVPYVAVHLNYVTDEGKIRGSGYFAASETKVGKYIGRNYERVGKRGQYVVYQRVDSTDRTDREPGDVESPTTASVHPRESVKAGIGSSPSRS